MKNVDARSLSKEAQEQNSKLAIGLRKEEITFIKIAKIIGVARQDSSRVVGKIQTRRS